MSVTLAEPAEAEREPGRASYWGRGRGGRGLGRERDMSRSGRSGRGSMQQAIDADRAERDRDGSADERCNG